MHNVMDLFLEVVGQSSSGMLMVMHNTYFNLQRVINLRKPGVRKEAKALWSIRGQGKWRSIPRAKQ